MGNGARAAQKRERNGKDGPKEPQSQLKSNAAAKTVKCKVCFQDFQSTVKKPELEKHVESKHSKKKYEECFPA